LYHKDKNEIVRKDGLFQGNNTVGRNEGRFPVHLSYWSWRSLSPLPSPGNLSL
jgi:hypothetical protein